MTDVAQEATVSAPKIEDVVAKYIALRNRKAEMDAAHKERMGAITEALDKVEVYLLQRMQEIGVESVRTAHGTAYTTTQVSVRTADRDAYLKFCLENDLLSTGLDVKPNKTFVQQYRKEHDDLPPGVDWREERTVNVRSK